jgi:hypothetical protein
LGQPGTRIRVRSLNGTYASFGRVADRANPFTPPPSLSATSKTREQPRISPLRAIIAGGYAQRLFLPDQHQQPLAPRVPRVDEVALEQRVVRRGERDHRFREGLQSSIERRRSCPSDDLQAQSTHQPLRRPHDPAGSRPTRWAQRRRSDQDDRWKSCFITGAFHHIAMS